MNIEKTLYLAGDVTLFLTKNLFVDSLKFKEFKSRLSAVSFDHNSMETTLYNFSGYLTDYKNFCLKQLNNEFDAADFVPKNLKLKVSIKL